MSANPAIDGLTTADVVAGNIRAEAARAGLSQVGLGRALMMSQVSITKRWRGVTPWQLAELDAVARVLGVTVAQLVTPPSMGAAPADGGGGRVARLKGLEPPTFWFVVDGEREASVSWLDDQRIRRSA